MDYWFGLYSSWESNRPSDYLEILFLQLEFWIPFLNIDDEVFLSTPPAIAALLAEVYLPGTASVRGITHFRSCVVQATYTLHLGILLFLSER